MSNSDFQEESLNLLAHLVGEVQELKVLHERMMSRMLSEHRRRVELLDQVIAGQKRRDKKIDKLIDHTFDNEDEWWKRGEAPPWN